MTIVKDYKMPFKTTNFTVMEYYNMDLIMCVEYENANDSNDKVLKIVVSREYDQELINIFNFKNIDDIPKEALDIYNYSKTVSKIIKEEETYAICGQRINKRNNDFKKILFNNIDPLAKDNVEISTEILSVADIDFINNETSEYYNRVLQTIKWRCDNK